MGIKKEGLGGVSGAIVHQFYRTWKLWVGLQITATVVLVNSARFPRGQWLPIERKW